MPGSVKDPVRKKNIYIYMYSSYSHLVLRYCILNYITINWWTHKHMLQGKGQNIMKTCTEIPQKGKVLPWIPNSQMCNLLQMKNFLGSHYIIYSTIVVKELSSSVLKCIATRYRILYLQLFSFSTLKIPQCFLISSEMRANNLTATPLEVTWFLQLFKIFSFSLSF